MRLSSEHSHEVGGFAAASYVWGSGTKEYCTTRDNLQQRQKDGIQISTLPRTIRDFITVSRRLQLTYLWVDALCIVQDNEEETREQVKLMVSFYSRSEVVLSASMANHSDQGFLPNPRSVESSYGVIYELPYRHQLPHGYEEGTVLLSENNLYNENEPTTKRMWISQEEKAEIRGLHFGSRQIHWTCKEAQWVDGGRLKPDLNHGFDFSSGKDVASHMLLSEWMKQVADFSSRDFSTRNTVSDRLNAFSITVDQHCSKSGWSWTQFHVGLWNVGFPWSLLWKRAAPQPVKLLNGPSWSWLSVIGQVEYSVAVKFSWRERYTVEIQHFPADATGKTPLVLTGRTMEFFHHGARNAPLHELESDSESFVWDVYLEPQPVWLLAVMADKGLERTWGLILRRHELCPNSFNRCGYFDLKSATDSYPNFIHSEWSEPKMISVFLAMFYLLACVHLPLSRLTCACRKSSTWKLLR